MSFNFKIQSDGTYVRFVKIHGILYKLTVNAVIWNTKNVSRHVTYWIHQMKSNKECVFKYGTVEIVEDHTDEQYICSSCNKDYKTRNGLLRHIKKHHPDTTKNTPYTTIPNVVLPRIMIPNMSLSTPITPQSLHSFPIEIKPTTNGYVYCFSNESMPGIYKIGMTRRDIPSRLRDANKGSTWSTPTPYKAELSIYVENPHKTERYIHIKLKEYRVTSHREFFKLPLSTIKELFDTIGTYVLDHKGELDNVRTTL